MSLLGDIRAAHAKLDQLDAELSMLVTTLEDSIGAHLSIRIGMRVELTGLDGNPVPHSIAFGKHQGDRWCLLVDGVPLNKVSRIVRAKALAEGAVLKLLESAPVLVAAQLGDRAVALTHARELIGKLR